MRCAPTGVFSPLGLDSNSQQVRQQQGSPGHGSPYVSLGPTPAISFLGARSPVAPLLPPVDGAMSLEGRVPDCLSARRPGALTGFTLSRLVRTGSRT